LWVRVHVSSPMSRHPRRVGFNSHGRSPGSRVIVNFVHLPKVSLSGLERTLTAYSRGGGCGFTPPKWIGAHHIPI
jgi:hypothetical protein